MHVVDSHPLPSGRDCIVETVKRKELVEALKGNWKRLWREQIVDREKSEGIANQDYPRLFIDQGTVIQATRDFKPPDFVEILHQHLITDAQRYVPPPPQVGGWGKFMRTTLRKQRRSARRRAPPKPERKKPQQVKKRNSGWLHFRMK